MVSGTNKVLVQRYLNGLATGHAWDEAGVTFSDDFVFFESGGFRAGPDYIRSELNRMDRRSSNATVQVWDGGNTFAFCMKNQLHYTHYADPSLAGKSFHVTTFGVVVVREGEIAAHEQRTDHFFAPPFESLD